MIKKRSHDSERLLVRPKRACYLLDCGTTYLYELIAKGELRSFLDGRSRKITVDSIHQYIAKRLTPAAENRVGFSAGRHDFQKPAKVRVASNACSKTQGRSGVGRRSRRFAFRLPGALFC
jgi:excisionase family DNA binding protein